MSPKAAEPLTAAKSKNKTKQQQNVSKQKPRVRKAERSQESRNRDPLSEASSVRPQEGVVPVRCMPRAGGKAPLQARGTCCLLSGPGRADAPEQGPWREAEVSLVCRSLDLSWGLRRR